MLVSQSCLLIEIAHSLHVPSRKINVVDRLSQHLAKGIPRKALKAYLSHVKKGAQNSPSNEDVRLWFRPKRPITVNFVLSWSSEQASCLVGRKEYISQSPIPAGLIKVPLIMRLPFWIFQKIGRLVLWEAISFILLQFAETQVMECYQTLSSYIVSFHLCN